MNGRENQEQIRVLADCLQETLLAYSELATHYNEVVTRLNEHVNASRR
jgi:hypothetical protein